MSDEIVNEEVEIDLGLLSDEELDLFVLTGGIDLDTVKPGLAQYDIGDCLRTGCNPLGEEDGLCACRCHNHAGDENEVWRRPLWKM